VKLNATHLALAFRSPFLETTTTTVRKPIASYLRGGFSLRRRKMGWIPDTHVPQFQTNFINPVVPFCFLLAGLTVAMSLGDCYATAVKLLLDYYYYYYYDDHEETPCGKLGSYTIAWHLNTIYKITSLLVRTFRESVYYATSWLNADESNAQQSYQLRQNLMQEQNACRAK